MLPLLAIAHDLRTPLCRMRTQLDRGLRCADPGHLAEAARGAMGDIDQLLHLFDQLLQLAETESGVPSRSFTPVSLAKLLDTVTGLFGVAAAALGARLARAADEDAVVLGDAALLSALLANLVENALKYGASQGAVVTLSLGRSEQGVELRVEDNGPGIPPAARERVFERFHRLDRGRSQPGHGLGLTLAAAIAALHGGRILLEDAGPGLRARVILPEFGRNQPEAKRF